MAWKKPSSPPTQRQKRPRNLLHGICQALPLPLQPKTTPVIRSTLLQQHDPQQTASKSPISPPQMAKTSLNIKGSLPQRWTEPTNNQQIHDAYSADKRRAQRTRDTTIATNTLWPPQRNQYNTATDDSILSRSTPRYLTRTYPKSSTLSFLERCQGWVPSESLKKFLLEVDLYN